MCDACDSGIGRDPVRVRQWLDQYDARMRAIIRRSGWAIQFVEDGAGADSIAYTVGLTELGHPEIVVHGLPPAESGPVLNALGELVRTGAVTFYDGTEVQLPSGRPLRMFALPNPGDVVLTANRLYHRPPWESVPVLQAVYPDEDGAWPWEPSCRPPASRQPMPGTVIL